MNLRAPAIGVVSVLVAASAFAQQGVDARHRSFEVASVKPNPADHARGRMGILPGGRFEAVNATAMLLITFAYDLRPDFVDGAPEWVRADRLDVQAKAADPAASAAQLRPAYALARMRPNGPLGPKMRAAATDCDARMKDVATGTAPFPMPPPATGLVAPCLIRSRLGVAQSGGISMAGLANVLYQGAERIVIDKTGLPGWYEVELDYRPFSAPPDSPDTAALPSIFAALEEQLGLTLVSERTLLPTLVIDRISRPTPD